MNSKQIFLTFSVFLFFTELHSNADSSSYVDTTWSKTKRYEYKINAGKAESILRANAAAYYVNYWKAMRDDFKSSGRRNFPERAAEILQDPLRDIKIIELTGNWAIVEHSVTLNAFDDITRGKSLWQFTDNTWRPIIWVGRFWKIQLVDLNGDNISDVLAWGGCCGWTALNIHIGQADGTIRQTQGLQFIREPKMTLGKPCSGMLLLHTNQDSDKYGDSEVPLQFDCKTLQFIKP